MNSFKVKNCIGKKFSEYFVHLCYKQVFLCVALWHSSSCNGGRGGGCTVVQRYHGSIKLVSCEYQGSIKGT